jgi:peptide/nickel transport system permease protein
MGRFIARRLAQGLLIIFGVTVFVFVVTRIVGDPVKFMLPLSATEEEREATREALRLNEPLLVQFWHFLGNLLHLDLGTSTYVRGQPALDVVFDAVPHTDLETGQAILSLLQRGYLVPVG